MLVESCSEDRALEACVPEKTGHRLCMPLYVWQDIDQGRWSNSKDVTSSLLSFIRTLTLHVKDCRGSSTGPWGGAGTEHFSST
jgi:hypothetical protein